MSQALQGPVLAQSLYQKPDSLLVFCAQFRVSRCVKCFADSCVLVFGQVLRCPVNRTRQSRLQVGLGYLAPVQVLIDYSENLLPVPLSDVGRGRKKAKRNWGR